MWRVAPSHSSIRNNDFGAWETAPLHAGSLLCKSRSRTKKKWRLRWNGEIHTKPFSTFFLAEHCHSHHCRFLVFVMAVQTCSANIFLLCTYDNEWCLLVCGSTTCSKRSKRKQALWLNFPMRFCPTARGYQIQLVVVWLYLEVSHHIRLYSLFKKKKYLFLFFPLWLCIIALTFFSTPNATKLCIYKMIADYVIEAKNSRSYDRLSYKHVKVLTY